MKSMMPPNHLYKRLYAKLELSHVFDNSFMSLMKVKITWALKDGVAEGRYVF